MENKQEKYGNDLEEISKEEGVSLQLAENAERFVIQAVYKDKESYPNTKEKMRKAIIETLKWMKEEKS